MRCRSLAASAGAVVPVELDVTKLSAAANKVVVEPETVMNATAGGLLLSQGVDKSQSFKVRRARSRCACCRGLAIRMHGEQPAGAAWQGSAGGSPHIAHARVSTSCQHHRMALLRSCPKTMVFTR